jgi:hypothetical protein
VPTYEQLLDLVKAGNALASAVIDHLSGSYGDDVDAWSSATDLFTADRI